MDIDTMTNDLNKAITDTAQEILGKERRIKQPWMTRELLEKCDRMRELKNKKGSTEGAAMHRLINKDKYHNQIDYILVQQRFRSSVKTAKTRSFPGADIGSDHDLLLLNFHLRLKMNQRPKHTRVKFDLGKLNDTTTARAYQETLAGKLATIQNRVDDVDIETMTNDLNTAITDTAQ